MKIHFIAIGGSIMHNLAICLKNLGYTISGSDDNIYNPAEDQLKKANIYPNKLGWDANRITKDLDFVITGMHAKIDNPEIIRAKELNLEILSFPEFIRKHSENKQRIVIGGSHGKTTITSMVMHVLKQNGLDFDYLVGANLEGFDVMVKLSDAPIIVLEGDEYLNSALDPTPKFLKYDHHIGVLSGVEWDHINAFPTEEIYIEQFRKFADKSPKAGTFIYCETDPISKEIGMESRDDVTSIPYKAHSYKIVDGKTILLTDFGDMPIQIFGKHNMENLSAAKEVAKQLCIGDLEFYQAIQTFNGSAKRLETIYESPEFIIYQDFAHSPSKAKASINAVKEQHPNKKLIAVLELHTFSSLNPDFLSQYKNTTLKADEIIVFMDKDILKKKGSTEISENQIKEFFNDDRVQLIDNSESLRQTIKESVVNQSCLLIMSSGNLGGLKPSEFIIK